jgi:hypothetical protein
VNGVFAAMFDLLVAPAASPAWSVFALRVLPHHGKLQRCSR